MRREALYENFLLFDDEYLKVPLQGKWQMDSEGKRSTSEKFFLKRGWAWNGEKLKNMN